MNGWRQQLRQWFCETVHDLDPALRMRPVVDAWRDRARLGEPFLVLAYGKAARGMAQALADGLRGANLRGLVVPPEPDDAPLPPFEVIAGGHPLPTAGSVRAAKRALELAGQAQREDTVLFLASGGGSSMLELPAFADTPLAELRAFYAALIGCGADIVAVNTVRQHLSAIKGGRLALAAARAGRQQTIEISDVPERAGAVVASGPSHPTASTIADCRALLDRLALRDAVPEALAACLDRHDLPPVLSTAPTATEAPGFVTIAANHHARRALGDRVRAAGALVVEDLTVDDLPYERAAEVLLRRLDRLRRRHAGRPVAIVTGGELSVRLPANPGTGGRNQQFALHCARAIRGMPIAVLSAGTDGIDGNSPAAGAIVDGTTLARARRHGLDARLHEHRFDAFPLFSALGDSVETGPTGTNVRDVRVLIAHG